MHPAKLAGTAYRNCPCHTGRGCARLIGSPQSPAKLAEEVALRSSRAQHPDAVLASERAKEGADVLGQQLWFLKRCKVATPGHHSPLLEVVEAFGPLPRCLADLLRKA